MKFYCLLLFFMLPFAADAQQFIDKAVVEYEVKTNIHKTLGDNPWAEKMKENLPQFKTSYYSLTFAENKNIYKFSRWDEKLKIPEFLKNEDEDKIWFFDYDKQSYSMKKSVFGAGFVVQDSVVPVKWKLINENRNIAGFNCRKAVGIIFDSVYVFAFYTDEITLPGGPCSINGLPGLILGMTIPRLYTSWIATSVQVNNVPVEKIIPGTAKKIYTKASLHTFLKERMKQFEGEDGNEWVSQIYWNAFL